MQIMDLLISMVIQNETDALEQKLSKFNLRAHYEDCQLANLLHQSQLSLCIFTVQGKLIRPTVLATIIPNWQFVSATRLL